MDTIPLVVETEISFGKMFYCTQIFFFILSDVYVALWDVLDVLKYEWNQSDISLKLFNAYIYTDVTCICTQCYYFCISVKMLLCHSTCFKCLREITPASLMQLQHFIFTCLLQCKSAFFFLFPVYEINGNILYF